MKRILGFGRSGMTVCMAAPDSEGGGSQKPSDVPESELLKEAGIEDVDAITVGKPVGDTSKGAFFESLNRSFPKVREDRAVAVAEEAELKFKRLVEDLEMSIRVIERKRSAMLDMSSSSALSIKSPDEIDTSKFVKQYYDTTLDLRAAKINYVEAKRAYNQLFGGK